MKCTVKQTRVLADFTQTKMAKMLGISRDTYRKSNLTLKVQKYLRQKRFPKLLA